MGLRVSGGLNPVSFEAENHAAKFYTAILKRDTDIVYIAHNTGFSIEQIQLIKYYLFRSLHTRFGHTSRFDPDYSIAESWRRLSSKDGKNIQKHDVLLLYHELYEINLLLNNTNLSQQDAHKLAEQKYNYGAVAKSFYKNQKFKSY